MLGSVRELIQEGIDVIVKRGEVFFLMQVNHLLFQIAP
ncbi:hypothetical protein GGP77_002843 [Salinibacter ruber]|jgi:hypothetical protein|uniref:Uncharacterized protein n=1 Tax=Salinibacter ruber TaxID=146919 RepID=A0A9X2UMW9_9BACT|nr:hypothetical protein [Salinibacter ruber]MCS3616262.1 hypothetical protein [Salinibacter ruber]MCS3668592.1 hypothetical protein [Salinibacter ruber]MCS3675608.1 hypothetical protein [Salinibacter ruber]MCS3783551.1 hypothetical protein [Salinibacter ruber]